MKIQKTTLNQKEVTIVNCQEICIKDVQSALDFMMTISYETGCRHIIVNKEAFHEDFFDLKTKIAGDILQKFVNYHFKLAIVGDFMAYQSKALRDFMYESNKGHQLFFQPTIKDALQKITL